MIEYLENKTDRVHEETLSKKQFHNTEKCRAKIESLEAENDRLKNHDIVGYEALVKEQAKEIQELRALLVDAVGFLVNYHRGAMFEEIKVWQFLSRPDVKAILEKEGER